MGRGPRGEFRKSSELTSGKDVEPQSAPESAAVNPHDYPDLMELLTAAARCNNATLSPVGDDADTWQVIGDPTEGSLVVAALKAGIEARDHNLHVLFEIPFDSERKAMSVVLGGPNGLRTMYSKGAPEVILASCSTVLDDGNVRPLTDDHRREVMRWNSEMASRALRVLALASRDHSHINGTDYEETDLNFIGLIGMIDPPPWQLINCCVDCPTNTETHPCHANCRARLIR